MELEEFKNLVKMMESSDKQARDLAGGILLTVINDLNSDQFTEVHSILFVNGLFEDDSMLDIYLKLKKEFKNQY